jgi:hypothetical protein
MVLAREFADGVVEKSGSSWINLSSERSTQLPLAQIREIQKRLLDANDSPEPIWETLRQGEQEGQIQDIEIYKRAHGQDIKTQK